LVSCQFEINQLKAHNRPFNTNSFNHGLRLKKPSWMSGQSDLIVIHKLQEATMLKLLFSKSLANSGPAPEALEQANLALLSRVTQVLQAATRNQEKHSTVTNLRPLAN
jgi:hypothetical protein